MQISQTAAGGARRKMRAPRAQLHLAYDCVPKMQLPNYSVLPDDHIIFVIKCIMIITIHMINIVIDNILLISSPNLLSEKLLPQFIPAPLPAPAPGPAPAPTLRPPRPLALDPKGQEPKVFKSQKMRHVSHKPAFKNFWEPHFRPPTKSLNLPS